LATWTGFIQLHCEVSTREGQCDTGLVHTCFHCFHVNIKPHRNPQLIGSSVCNSNIALCEIKEHAISTEDVKKTCSRCRICAELKPQFYHPTPGTLIKATQPCFLFAFPCPNMHSSTVIKCLDQIFTLFSMPSYIHSVLLSLRSKNLSHSEWEVVLSDALHSIWSLPSTSTNTTPHERFFGFQRHSSYGTLMPSWLHSPGPALHRRFVRKSKNYPLVDQLELQDVNPTYVNVRYHDARESRVSLRDLAPCPYVPMDVEQYSQVANPCTWCSSRSWTILTDSNTGTFYSWSQTTISLCLVMTCIVMD